MVEVVPALHHRQPDRVKVFHLRRLNAAEAEVRPGSDLQSRVRQVGQLEPREEFRHLSCKAHRNRQNMVGRRREDWARRQLPARAGQEKFRRRVASEDLSVNGSERRRLPAQVNLGNAAEVRRLDSVNRSLRQVVQELRMKRAAKEKESRALMLNRHHRRSAVARLREPSVARDRDSQDRDNPKVERENRKKERHHQGHDSPNAINVAAPDQNSGAAFLWTSGTAS